MNSYKELALRILIITSRDLSYEGKDPYHVRAHQEAKKWISNRSGEHLFSISGICEILGLDGVDEIYNNPSILKNLDIEDRGGRVPRMKKKIKKKKIKKEIPKGKFSTNSKALVKEFDKYEEESAKGYSNKKYKISEEPDGSKDATMYYDIGFWHGYKVSEMCDDYEGRNLLRWMLGKDFPEELKEVIEEHLGRDL